MKKQLTENIVRGLKAEKKPYWITDAGHVNLRLKIGISGKKSWYYSYSAGGKDNSHKLGDADIMTVTEARNAATKFKSDLLDGELPSKKKAATLTLGELIERHYAPWITMSENKKSGNETLCMLRAQFEQFYNKAVSTLTVLDIENWRSSRKREEKKVKSSSLNRYRAALLSMINWAVGKQLIDVNPLQRFKRLEEYDSDPIVRYLTDDERGRLMNALDEREKRLKTHQPNAGTFADHLKPVVIIALNTALRRGSLLSLIWGDIDLDGKIITVRASTAKNKKTQRVPMNTETHRTLLTWRDQSADTSPDAYVFPSPKGGKMHDCRSAWDNLLKAAEIENFRWHDMRHDAATRLRRRGAAIDIVQKALGHADLRMTQRYAHIEEDIVRNAMESLCEDGNSETPRQ